VNIGIIGTGRMGTGFGRRFAAAGHQVIFGSREPHERADALRNAGLQAQVATVESAAYLADALVLAVPGAVWKKALKGAGDLRGKIIIDCTNNLDDDWELAKGFSTSNAEEIADEYPDAKVVKAFNSTFAGVLEAGPDYPGGKAVVFYAGDDAASKETVGRLISELGFEPVDAGPLRVARYMEPAACLMIKLAYTQNIGPQIALKLLNR
jgi:predicted dinucleotide-binding enzyme